MKQDFLNKLSSIITYLRSENGCAWDRKQTSESLISSMIEELYEVIEAIYKKDDKNLKEELGDLFFLILLQIEIKRQENKFFTLEKICEIASEKLIRRHPHIFGEKKQNLTESEVKNNWEKIKKEEKLNKTSTLSYFQSINPLRDAIKIQKEAAQFGLDWKNKSNLIDKLKEETDEFIEAVGRGEKKNVEEEIGDIFFTVLNLCRHFDVSPEKAIIFANLKFKKRFKRVEDFIKEENKKFSDYNLNQLESIWQKIKK